MRKLLVVTALIGAIALYLANGIPMPTKDCSEQPTADCLKKAIGDFNYSIALGQKQYRYYGNLLIEAGFYKEGLELLKNSDSSLVQGSLYQGAAMKIAEEALTHPNKVASFVPMERLLDVATEEGALFARNNRTASKSTALMRIAHTLIAADSGAGDSNYVQYNEKSAEAKFTPNKTWDAVIAKWRDGEAMYSGPQGSGSLLILISVLTRVNENEKAQEILKLVEPNEQNSLRYIRELKKLGLNDEALGTAKEFRPKHEFLLAKAELAIDEEAEEKAILILVEAAEELIKATHLKMNGTDRGDFLRNVSTKLYEIGEKEAAVKMADKALHIHKEGPNYIGFTGHERIASHYRTIGAKKEAMAMLQEAASKHPCSPFTGLEHIAREYYLLGDIEQANNTISQMCGSVSAFGSTFGIKTAKIDKEKMIQNFWKSLYAEAVALGKDTEEISKYMNEDTIEAASVDIAMHSLNLGKQEIGEQYLEAALNSGNVGCHLAYLASSADREDLLLRHLKKALEVIPNKYRGLERQAAYLRLAACHNKIRIDRLRLKHS